MDAEAARTFLPGILKVAPMRAQGKSPDEIQAFITDGSATPIPSRPGVIYMLSDQNRLASGEGAYFRRM